MKKCAFLGSKDLGLKVLKAIEPIGGVEWRIFHPVDDKDVRSNRADFNQFARERQIDILSVASPSAATEAIRDFAPDIAMVCGWYWLIGPEMLDTCKFYGVHNSLLPKYRGGSPLVWSIIAGDEYVGSSCFEITEGMDDGNVVFQVSVPNSSGSDIGTLLRDIESSLLRDIPDHWRGLLENRTSGIEQDHAQATYCGLRIPDDGLIDWTKSVSEVHNFIRAQTHPYPGAFTMIGSRKLSIWKSAPVPEPWLGTPGQVLQRGKQDVLVACGDGAISIQQCSLDGIPTEPKAALSSIKLRL